MAIEIVDFPMKNGGFFHSFLYVYQRVLVDNWLFLWFKMVISMGFEKNYTWQIHG